MSGLASVETSPRWDIAQDQCISTKTFVDYADMPSLPPASVIHTVNGRNHVYSPQPSTSSPSPGRSASFGCSSNATSHSPPTRAGTPIRRQHYPAARRQSHIRPETIFPLATYQDPPLSISPGMTMSPPSFPSAGYMMAPSTSSYPEQSCYHPTAGSGPQPLVSSLYSLAPNESTYGATDPSKLYTSQDLSTIHRSPEPLGSNAVSGPWSASTGATHAPAFHPSTSFSNSPHQWMEKESVRRIDTRQKPQCFDHGCNGRQFSTFSNLLRHQREKSGNAVKHKCPHCPIRFTRTTARKGHVEDGKCKTRDRRNDP